MFVAVNKNGSEYIYENEPVRTESYWVGNGSFMEVPKGAIKRLLGYPLKWEDDCQEIAEYKVTRRRTKSVLK